MEQAVDDGEDGGLGGGGAFLKDFNKEAEHVEGEVRVEVVKVFHHTPTYEWEIKSEIIVLETWGAQLLLSPKLIFYTYIYP